MAHLYYDSDANPQMLDQRTIAVLGYGSQGHAHALNLHDSGARVVVGLRPGSPSWPRAKAEGLRVTTPAEAVRQASIVMVLAPDTAQKALYEEAIARHLQPGDTLMFAHGFNIRYGQISPPPGVDVSMVAPKSPGHRVRELYLQGEGTPALIAIEVDATGQAKQIALAYARALGCTRAGVLQTTFAEETETDLFGEQAVLCGGVTALVKAGFDTLVEAGYQPELAYFECLHELKLIVDLMYRGGLGEMWHSVSDTAEHGGYEGGDRLITADTRREMQRMLEDIRHGRFAEAWIAENRAGRPTFDARRAAEKAHRIEDVGQGLRAMMGFLGQPAGTQKTPPEAAPEASTATPTTTAAPAVETALA